MGFLDVDDQRPGITPVIAVEERKNMTDQQPPKIEFPCPDYPIKVMGEASEEYKAAVLEVMEVHAPGFDRSRVTVRDSRNGRFHSVTIYIEATGIDQLKNLFEDLKKLPATRMVL
ncbi:hypothetical protein TDB9533_01772 [Thalassocella blandensis]|nr:hypothetical protein TDB9533_01772 [Thalassocella blandensis]